MRANLILVTGIVLVCGLTAFYLAYRAGSGRREKRLPKQMEVASQERVTVGDFVLVPSSVSQQRITNSGLPSAGSEDKRELLVAPKLIAENEPDEERDYRPQDSIEWVIDIRFTGDPLLLGTDLSRAFNSDWLRANGSPSLFGWSPEINHWTYLFSADAPRTFTKICLGWPLFRRFGDDKLVSAEDLERFQKSTLNALERFGAPIATLNRSASDAVALSMQIDRVFEECERDAALVLVAPSGVEFDGQQFWEVMKSLGLEWGDGDLFHWRNDSGIGDDYFFSVATRTPPGYFLPEEIAAGNVKLGDLVFAYSIPRSAAPEEVFESMVRAIQYAQNRLGGTVTDLKGTPLDVAAMKAEITQIVERLREAGLEPGSDPVLHIF